MANKDKERPAHKFVASKKDIKRLNKAHGVKFVPCYGQAPPPKEIGDRATHSTSKIPLVGKDWQHQLKDWRAAHFYVEKRKAHLGGYPQAMLPVPHFVADIDKGGKDAVLQVKRGIGQPRGWYETFSKGKYHLWYPCMEADRFPDGGDIILNGMHLGEIKTGNTIISNIAKLRKDFDENPPVPLDYETVMENLGVNDRQNTSERIYLNGEEVLKRESQSLKQAIDEFPPSEGARRPMFFKLACWCGKWNDREQGNRLLAKAHAALDGVATKADIERQFTNGWNLGQKDAKENPRLDIDLGDRF